MAARIFRAKLQTVTGKNFVYITMPFSVEKEFRMRGRVPVAGTLDGVPFRSSVFPAMGRLRKGLVGKHFLVVNQRMRKALGKRPGGTVKVMIYLDTKARTVEIPPEFKRLLVSEGMLETFNSLPYTQRKEYVLWVERSKTPEARERRLKMILLAMKRRKARAAEKPAPAVSSRATLPRRPKKAAATPAQRKTKAGPSAHSPGHQSNGKKSLPKSQPKKSPLK